MPGERPRYRLPAKRDWRKSILYVAGYVFFIALSAFLLIPTFGAWGMVAWLVLCVGLAGLILTRWHASSTAYRCPHCGHEFEISAWRDLITPHKMDKYYLKCPACGERNWMQVLVKEEPEQE